jgi:hypothetical protein
MTDRRFEDMAQAIGRLTREVADLRATALTRMATVDSVVGVQAQTYAGGTRICYCTSTTAVNNSTTFVDAPGLSLSVEPNSVYAFHSVIQYQSDTTADYKYQFVMPTDAFGSLSLWGTGTGESAINSSIYHDAFGGFGSTAGGMGTGTVATMRLCGAWVIGGIGGTVKYQFAQNSAVGSDTSTNLYSWIQATRLV